MHFSKSLYHKVDNHFLNQLNCKTIFDLRELFLKQGFENESLSIKNARCFALQSMGDSVYLEYLNVNMIAMGIKSRDFPTHIMSTVLANALNGDITT